MLSNQRTGDPLLNNKQRPSSTVQRSQNKLSDQIKSKSVTSKISKNGKKESKQQKQFTIILKVFNIILGIAMVIFGIYCYYNLNSLNKQSTLQFIGYILPGYIILSGLLIFSIEFNIRFITRNMKFLYNYFGRGIFNLYVGVMPLSLLDQSQGNSQPYLQKVGIWLLFGLLMFVGVLYIVAKIFCCAKQGQKRKKRKQQKENQSDSSQNQQ